MTMRLADVFSGSSPTILGIGPMSAATVRAGLRAAAQTRPPAVFIARRKQVGSAVLGGGAVEGWVQAGVARFLREEPGRWPGKAQWFVGRDHGGPWQRDDEYRSRIPWPLARDRALRSLHDDIDAGFHCLHIDVAKDP